MATQPTFIDRGPTTLWKVACMICAILSIISLALGVFALHTVMGEYSSILWNRIILCYIITEVELNLCAEPFQWSTCVYFQISNKQCAQKMDSLVWWHLAAWWEDLLDSQVHPEPKDPQGVLLNNNVLIGGVRVLCHITATLSLGHWRSCPLSDN